MTTLWKKAVKTARVMSLCAMAVWMMAACQQQTATESETAGQRATLTLEVSDDGWGQQTRASYGSLVENNGNKNFDVTFTTGDAMGIYMVDTDGKVVVANRKYIYNGSAWQGDPDIEYVRGMGNYHFFAYYPYQDTMDDAPAVGDTPTLTTAEEFFEEFISGWTPAADQGNVDKFTASDLMVCKGNTARIEYMEIQLSLNFKHKMGMLVTKPELAYYDIDNPSDTWTVTQTFTTNIPYNNGGICYFLCKPGVATTLGTKTTTVAAGQVEQLYFTNGEPGNR